MTRRAVPDVPEDGTDYGDKSYCVMNNWLPQFSGDDTYDQIYDLKGSADDKTLVRRRQKIPGALFCLPRTPHHCDGGALTC